MASSFSGQIRTELLVVLIMCCLMGVVVPNDDYDLLARMVANRERLVRSGANNELPQDGGLYSIQSAHNGMYLTARNGLASPGHVLMKKYSEAGSQLWLATKFDINRGYTLKPFANEFNEVTSTLQDNAHSFNAWEFKPAQPITKDKNRYIIYNTLNKRCLQTANLGKPVQFANCQPHLPLQHWKLHKID